MSAEHRMRRRPRWGSLLLAMLCAALALAILFFVPASPINTSHTQQAPAPGSVTLPPTTTPPVP